MSSSSLSAVGAIADGAGEEGTTAGRLGDQLVRLLRLAGQGHNHLPEVYREGIEKVGYVLLWRLAEEGPQRTTTLAEAVHSDISTVSRHVTALVKQGWIERMPDPDDGRAYLLVATDTGRAVFERIRARRNGHLARALADWPDAERAELIRLLRRLNDDIERYLPGAHGQADTTTRGERE